MQRIRRKKVFVPGVYLETWQASMMQLLTDNYFNIRVP